MTQGRGSKGLARVRAPRGPHRASARRRRRVAAVCRSRHCLHSFARSHVCLGAAGTGGVALHLATLPPAPPAPPAPRRHGPADRQHDAARRRGGAARSGDAIDAGGAWRGVAHSGRPAGPSWSAAAVRPCVRPSARPRRRVFFCLIHIALIHQTARGAPKLLARQYVSADRVAAGRRRVLLRSGHSKAGWPDETLAPPPLRHAQRP